MEVILLQNINLSFFLFVCLCLAEEAFLCKTQAVADIVILVDGSWSIGRINFRLVRTFLESLVRAFDVDFDKTRIGERVFEDRLIFREMYMK